MNKTNLERMIIIPPEIFDKWKHIITEDQNLSELDRKMKTILYDKNLNNINKWYQYRENLLKYSFSKKSNPKFDLSLKPITSEKSMQTNRVVKLNQMIQTEDELQYQNPHLINQAVQTENDYNKNVFESNKNDEVFGTHLYSESDESDEIDLDDKTRALALQGVPKNVKITRERLSIDPSSYKAYELSNGEVVTVPTERTRTTTTRSMRKRLESSSGEMKQTTIPFKKIKPPSSGKPRTQSSKLRSNSNTRRFDNVEKNIQWEEYK